MAYPVALTIEDWARVRYEYECTERKVADICAEHGMSEGTLQNRVRRWGWARRRFPVPSEGPPPMVVPMIAFRAPETPAAIAIAAASPLSPMSPRQANQGVDGRDIRAFTPVYDGAKPGHDELSSTVPDTRPIGERMQGAIAQVMPALETTLSSLAAGPMQPRQMEQAARALGSLTRTLRELNGLVEQYGAQGGDDQYEDADALRESLKRQIDALIEEEREARPRRYLAAWEEFAAEAANGNPQYGHLCGTLSLALPRTPPAA